MFASYFFSHLAKKKKGFVIGSRLGSSQEKNRETIFRRIQGSRESIVFEKVIVGSKSGIMSQKVWWSLPHKNCKHRRGEQMRPRPMVARFRKYRMDPVLHLLHR